MRFDDRITGNVKTYAPNAKIIHIDIDSSEFDKNIATTATVHGDAREVLKKLIPLIEPKKRTEWLGTFEQPEKVELEKVIEPAIHPTGERMTMGEVVNRVSEATGHNAIVVTDVGQNQMLSARYFKYTEPRSILTSGGLGTMGFGLPAAIGAKMGAPDRTVCFFTGDGGLQMTIQELGTILEYHTDVKIILLNNNFLGNVRQWQALFFNDRFSQTPLVNPDFVMIAKAYGLGAEEVKCREELDGAIERMLNHDGAYLINVNIDEHDMIFPMTPAGSNVDHIMLNASECYPTE